MSVAILMSMSTAAKRSRTARKASAAKAKPITVRLAPELQRGMNILRVALKRPVNKMINEAVHGFIQKRTSEVEMDLEGTLAQIKAYKRRDPNFDRAFGQWADAEVKFGGEDPAEGVVIKTDTGKSKAGPTQRLVRNLLTR